MEDVYKEYDSRVRIENGFIPILGPLYLLGSYIRYRWNNRKEIRESRSNLKGIVGDFSEPEGLRDKGRVAIESVYFQARENSEEIREKNYAALGDMNENRQKSLDDIAGKRKKSVEDMYKSRDIVLKKMKSDREEALQQAV